MSDQSPKPIVITPESSAEDKRGLIEQIKNQSNVVIGYNLTLRWRPGTQPFSFDQVDHEGKRSSFHLGEQTEVSGRILKLGIGFGGFPYVMLKAFAQSALIIPLNDLETGLTG